MGVSLSALIHRGLITRTRGPALIFARCVHSREANTNMFSSVPRRVNSNTAGLSINIGPQQNVLITVVNRDGNCREQFNYGRSFPCRGGRVGGGM